MCQTATASNAKRSGATQRLVGDKHLSRPILEKALHARPVGRESRTPWPPVYFVKSPTRVAAVDMAETAPLRDALIGVAYIDPWQHAQASEMDSRR